MQCRYKAVIFFPNPYNEHHTACYGLSFVSTKTDLCSASTDVVLSAVHVILDRVKVTPDCNTRIFADDIFCD